MTTHISPWRRLKVDQKFFQDHALRARLRRLSDASSS